MATDAKTVVTASDLALLRSIIWTQRNRPLVNVSLATDGLEELVNSWDVCDDDE